MAKRHGKINNVVSGDKVHERRIRRLPKNFGCIRYLGPGRRNPYAVHKGSGGNDERSADGKTGKRPRAICYVPDWETGYKVLILVHAGVYEKGMERDDFQNCRCSSDDVSEKFILYAKKAMKELEILRSGGSIPGLYKDNADNNANVTGPLEEAKTEITSGSVESAEKEPSTGSIEAGKSEELGSSGRLEDVAKSEEPVRSDGPKEATKGEEPVRSDRLEELAKSDEPVRSAGPEEPGRSDRPEKAGKSGEPVACEQSADAEQGGMNTGGALKTCSTRFLTISSGCTHRES